MGMMINRRRVCSGKKLPYDAEIEYLDGDGNAYIILDYYSNNNTTIYCEVAYLGYVANRKNCDAFGNENSIYLSHWGDGPSLIGSFPGMATRGFGRRQHIIQFNKKYTVSVDNSHYIIDGYDHCTTPSTSIFTCPNKFYLFDLQGKSWSGRGWVRIYKFQISDNNVSLDLIPVRVGNVGYMYDKVSGQLFGNAGTGDFILGPDV